MFFSFSEAQRMLGEGSWLTRPGLRGRFVAKRGGILMLGSYIGETSLGSFRPYIFTEEDKMACDWSLFKREKPEAWEGCDAGCGKGN